jgi:hypothetical protein
MRRLLGPAAAAAFIVLAVPATLGAAVPTAGAAAQPTDTSTDTAPDTEPPDTEPPDTGTSEPAATTQPGGDTTTTAPSEDDGDDGSDFPWAVVIGIAVLGGLVVGLAVAVFGRRSRRAPATAGADRTELRNIVGLSEWVHDQASIELMAGTGLSPDRLRSGWADTRMRMVDLSSRCAAVAPGSERATAVDLQRLGQAIDGLTGALDTNVALRLRALSDPAAGDALRASNAAVDARRSDLGVALAGVRRHI